MAISGKRVIVLAPLNQRNILHETAPFLDLLQRLFSCLGMDTLGMHFFGGIMEKGSVRQKPEYLEEAFRHGRELAQRERAR
jgi:hypothetical protein